jgi:thiol-disulfide isomerase/thioredoxin
VVILLVSCVTAAARAGERAEGVDELRLQPRDDLAAAMSDAQSSGRPIAVWFVAAWCGACRRVEREVFGHEAMLALDERFDWVVIDVDEQNAIARQWSVEAVPQLVVLASNAEPIGRVVGYVEPEVLASFLGALAGGPVGERTGGWPAAPEPPAGGSRSRLFWTSTDYHSDQLCYAHVGYGPLLVRAQSPFQALRLAVRPRTPSTLRKGQMEARGSATWVNVWGPDVQGEYTLDFEMLQTALGFSYAFTDHVQLDAELGTRSRFGGALDGLTQGFHDLFGIDQNGRDEVPRGRFLWEIAPPGRQAVSLGDDDRGLFSRSLELTLQHSVTCGKGRMPAFSYAGTARLNLGDNDDFSSGNDVDLAVSVASSRRVGRFYVYLNLSHVWFGSDDFRGLDLDGTQFSGLLALEWRVAPRHSLSVQYLGSEGVLDRFRDFSSVSNEVTLGYKWELRPGTVLELGIIENVIKFDNSPDFGIHAGLLRRF